MSLFGRKVNGELTAADARYCVLFPISGDQGKVLWFRNMEGIKTFLGDEGEQKRLMPFRIVHAREMRDKLHKSAWKKEMCCDEFPDDARAEIFEMRALAEAEKNKTVVQDRFDTPPMLAPLDDEELGDYLPGGGLIDPGPGFEPEVVCPPPDFQGQGGEFGGGGASSSFDDGTEIHCGGNDGATETSPCESSDSSGYSCEDAQAGDCSGSDYSSGDSGGCDS
jgi:hypothetical protein